MELIDGDGLNLLVETHSPQLDGNRVNFLSSDLPTPWNTCTSQGYLHRDICPRNVMVTARAWSS